MHPDSHTIPHQKERAVAKCPAEPKRPYTKAHESLFMQPDLAVRGSKWI